MKAKSEKLGKNTSVVEVQHISPNGFWLLVDDTEYFLSYGEFPWFKDATITQLLHVECQHEAHLHWPALDIDLDLDSLSHLEKYPLKYKA